MADTLGSVGVIISTILIYYFHWTGFDPIASLLIGLMILGSVVPLVIDCGRILCLDLTSTDTGAIEHALSRLTELPGVVGFSAVRFWPLDGGSLVGSIVRIIAQTRLYSISKPIPIPMASKTLSIIPQRFPM